MRYIDFVGQLSAGVFYVERKRVTISFVIHGGQTIAVRFDAQMIDRNIIVDQHFSIVAVAQVPNVNYATLIS